MTYRLLSKPGLLFGFILFALPISAQQLDHRLGEVLLWLKPDVSIPRLEYRIRNFKGKSTRFHYKETISTPAHLYLFEFDHTRINESDWLDFLRKQPEVHLAQWNHWASPRATIPNDPSFPQQWHWRNTGGTAGLEDADIDAELAWDFTTGGLTADKDTIVLAVLDDGFSLQHPDLAGNFWKNKGEVPNNGLDDDQNGYIDDYRGWNFQRKNDNIEGGNHGVQVAGVLGAHGNNNEGGSGLNWQVKIMGLSYATSDVSDAQIVAYYAYVLEQRRRYNRSGGKEGAFVVATNASWGITGAEPAEYPIWEAILDTLGTAGVLSVAAAPNSAINVDLIGDVPASFNSPYLITATASNSQDQLRSFAGFGLNTIDLLAPGDRIFTTTTAGYGFANGASFSAPAVTGTIGLLYSAPCPNFIARAKSDPEGTAAYVKNLILQGVDKLPAGEGKVASGGRLNAFNSIRRLVDECGSCQPPSAFERVTARDTSMTIDLAGAETGQNLVIRFQKIGTNSWRSIPITANVINIGGLDICSTYEIEYFRQCGDDERSASRIFSFSTNGCCIAPEPGRITPVGDSALLLSWNSAADAVSYLLRYRPYNQNDTGWLELALAENGAFLTGLSPCTAYEYQLATVCVLGGSGYQNTLLMSTSGCGACLDEVYCPSKGENADEEWIAAVQIGDWSHNSGSNNGLGDYTGITSLDLDIGSSYNVTLTPGFLRIPNKEYFKIWIDYNQDGQLDPMLELAYDPGLTTTTPISGKLNVPNWAKPGSTRLRISMKLQRPFSLPPEPCEAFFGFGEVEDYCVKLIGNPCFEGVSLEFDTTIQRKLQPHLTGISNQDAWSLQYRRKGDASWTAWEAWTDTAGLAALTPCTLYEIQIIGPCGDLGNRPGPAVLVQTPCATSVHNIDQDYLIAWPNPFDRIISWTIPDQAFATWQIIDIRGNILQSGNVQQRFCDLSTQPSGIYFLQMIKRDGSRISKKVVKINR